ncbi:MAG: HAMP domain-containing histidine kinase [Clostridia bacterium]|nr:HAMP domain-containing histidine kinase [Clostridia bacterium]
MKSDRRTKRLLAAINHYVIFFLLIAFVVTCCTMLFVTTLSKSLGVTLTSENISTAAKLTFGNVVLVSILFTVIDALRRKWTLERPAKEIAAATEKMIRGDFNVRIPETSKLATDENFGNIIDCINKMAEELSGVETLRTDFIANVSHEMKTPLSVIQNYGKLLQDPALDEEKRIEYAKALTDSSKKLSDMVTNILRLSRLENQKIYTAKDSYDLGEQLCECLLQFESVWEKRRIEIKTDIQENVEITADSELLSLIWNNLLSNAFKFTNDGGEVSISLSADTRFATVKIGDTGCGMSPKIGEHIFEKFYQGDTSHASEGNGLGLALVKRVADITGSEIGVESAMGVGTTFTVKIRRNLNETEK